MKKNTNGFTILEVIITMAILSVVIFIGYKVINGSDKASGAQKYTTKSQLSTNLINKYVSKDIEILEIKKDIEFKISVISIDSESKKYTQSYTYTIDTVNHEEGGKIVDIVEYEVKHEGDIKDDIISGVYSVNRKSKKKIDSGYMIISDLELISNQNTVYDNDSDMPVEDVLKNYTKPFSINKHSVDTNLYTVSIHYQVNNKEKDYAFDVSPRMSIANTEIDPPVNPEPPTKPEIDPDFDGNSAYIRFKQEDGLAWSDAGPKGNSANNTTQLEKYKPIVNISKIHAVIESGTSNGKVTTNMDDGKSFASAQNNLEFPQENYNQIKISLYGDVTLENITITVNYKGNGGSYTPIINGNIDQTKIINIDRTKNGHGQNNIIIDGNVKFKEGSNYGDVIINLGHSK